MRSDSADQKKDRHGEHVVPAKIMLYISMETGPATQPPLVAEVEPCSTSAFWSRRPHQRHPARDSTATGRGAVVGRWSLRFWYCESAVSYAGNVHPREQT